MVGATPSGSSRPLSTASRYSCLHSSRLALPETREAGYVTVKRAVWLMSPSTLVTLPMRCVPATSPRTYLSR